MWQTIGCSVQGSSHISKNKICQDAHEIRQGDDYIIAAIADGHGSDACIYSDEGSKIAVVTACDTIQGILNCYNENYYTAFKQSFEVDLPKQIEKSWKDQIKYIHEIKNQREPVENDKVLFKMYGTTLTAILICSNFVLAIQVGDGDILSVSDTGEASWFVESEKLLGVETDSLCNENSWRTFKTKLQFFPDGLKSMPELFLLSTDGYCNSFVNSESFLKIGNDYLEMFNNNGLGYIKENMKSWLEETSKEGCGDDITLVAIHKNLEAFSQQE